MKGYIYKIWNDINDKLYIGQTSISIESRFYRHCIDSKRRQCEKRPLYVAMNKYGCQHFHVELIEECELHEVGEREQYWIAYYNTYKYGYNATLGGEGSTLYDYNVFIDLYESGHTLKEIGQICHCDDSHVGTILKTLGYNTKVNGFNSFKKSIAAYDKQGKFIKSFESIGDAAQWLIDNNLTMQSAFESARAAIGRVANGKRKTAYGYIWKHE